LRDPPGTPGDGAGHWYLILEEEIKKLSQQEDTYRKWIIPGVPGRVIGNNPQFFFLFAIEKLLFVR